MKRTLRAYLLALVSGTHMALRWRLDAEHALRLHGLLECTSYGMAAKFRKNKHQRIGICISINEQKKSLVKLFH